MYKKTTEVDKTTAYLFLLFSLGQRVGLTTERAHLKVRKTKNAIGQFS